MSKLRDLGCGFSQTKKTLMHYVKSKMYKFRLGNARKKKPTAGQHTNVERISRDLISPPKWTPSVNLKAHTRFFRPEISPSPIDSLIRERFLLRSLPTTRNQKVPGAREFQFAAGILHYRNEFFCFGRAQSHLHRRTKTIDCGTFCHNRHLRLRRRPEAIRQNANTVVGQALLAK